MIQNFPVPFSSDGRRPRITSGWGDPRDGGARHHEGVDVFYPKAGEPKIPNWTQGNWIMFPNTPAIAVGPGVVTQAFQGEKGNWISIDHGDGMVSGYGHLSTRFLNKGDRVGAGQAVGIIGDDPSNPNDGAHLHFELKINGSKVDPKPYIVDAPVISAGGISQNTLLAAVIIGAAGLTWWYLS